MLIIFKKLSLLYTHHIRICDAKCKIRLYHLDKIKFKLANQIATFSSAMSPKAVFTMIYASVCQLGTLEF